LTTYANESLSGKWEPYYRAKEYGTTNNAYKNKRIRHDNEEEARSKTNYKSYAEIAAYQKLEITKKPATTSIITNKLSTLSKSKTNINTTTSSNALCNDLETRMNSNNTTTTAVSTLTTFAENETIRQMKADMDAFRAELRNKQTIPMDMINEKISEQNAQLKDVITTELTEKIKAESQTTTDSFEGYLKELKVEMATESHAAKVQQMQTNQNLARLLSMMENTHLHGNENGRDTIMTTENYDKENYASQGCFVKLMEHNNVGTTKHL
jgi:hypothetical protein